MLNRAPIAILGGTFDPVHNAHLAIGCIALERLRVARVLWMPTGAPEYRMPPVASAEDRMAMVKLAIAGEPRYVLDGRELASGASPYTVDTLRALREEFGAGVPLVLLIGADQYAKLGTWHRSKDLPALCRLAVFARPGWSANAGAEIAGDVIRMQMEPLAISASDIRARIGRGEDVSAMLPGAVLDYIRVKDLYR